MPRFDRILLIVNPVSGLARGRWVGERLRRRMEDDGSECVIRETSGEGDAQQWAHNAGENGFDLVVAIGGDGTLREAAAGMVGAEVKIPIAHIPVGTANVVAIALSLPWSTRLAAEVIRQGQVVSFDVGYLPELDRHFLLMAAIGYPARVIQDSPRRLKKVFGLLAYIGAGIRNARLLHRAQIVVVAGKDSVSVDGHTVLVTNIGRIREIGLKVDPTTSPHDGQFDVSVICSRTPWDLVKIIFRMLTWRFKAPPRLRHFQAEQIRVDAKPALPVQIDGEVMGTTPLLAAVLPSAIEMIVPKNYH